MTNDVKNLASYVTFKQLYDEGKKDIYSVIASFVESIIILNSLSSFSANEMSEMLKKEYGFDIPIYVLQSAIKRLTYVRKDNNLFLVDSKKTPKDETSLSGKYQNALTKNNSLVHSVKTFVEKRTGSLSNNQIKMLENELSQFLLDDSSRGDFTEYITAFIIDNEDSVIEKQLQEIKEGIVLLTGLSYNDDISNQSAWKNDLTLFVETDILFDLAGYNGEIFQIFAEELFALINEMNAKSGKKTIKVVYWNEVKEEFEKFFEAARLKIRDRQQPDLTNTAMLEIMKGCQSESDVVSKKSKFNRLLQTYSISEYHPFDYYNQEYHKYNLENPDTIEKYNLDESQEKYLRHVSYINILRHGENQKDINKSKYLLLTETGKILHIANDFNSDKSFVPNAINMNVLTNRLWFDLNKGFGKSIPSGFDVILKAKVVLSNVLSNSVSEKYERAKEAYNSNEISKEELLDTVLELKTEMVQPENISSSNIDDVLTVISTDVMNWFVIKQTRMFLEVRFIKKI